MTWQLFLNEYFEPARHPLSFFILTPSCFDSVIIASGPAASRPPRSSALYFELHSPLPSNSLSRYTSLLSNNVSCPTCPAPRSYLLLFICIALPASPRNSQYAPATNLRGVRPFLLCHCKFCDHTVPSSVPLTPRRFILLCVPYF